MSTFSKIFKDAAKEAGTLAGNHASSNAQNATNAAVDGMSLLKMKAVQIQNKSFELNKGNLFEYIEAAKFNRNAASAGSAAKAIVTDAAGDPHAVADILIQEQGEMVKQIQAKFSHISKDGKDISAATSVFEHTGAKNKGWGQYDGMDRLIRKQENYNEEGSLLDEAKKLSKKRADSNNIYSEYYKDVNDNLTDETHYNGVASGGTTIEEVREANFTPKQYGSNFEHQQVSVEMRTAAANMAKASLVTTGIVSGISNMFFVLRDKKSLPEALKDTAADSVRSGIRGGATGVLSTAIRYKGIKSGSALLSDSTAATLVAGGVIDGGAALYSYARGEITAEQLRDELIETTAKTTVTIFYTRVTTAVFGAAINPFIPIMVYTTANYVITCTREIINNAKFNIDEYRRMTAILQESTRTANLYHEQIRQYLSKCEVAQRKMFDDFIDAFNYNLNTGENYDEAIRAVIKFADHAGITLQYADFNEFNNAMNSDSEFELK